MKPELQYSCNLQIMVATMPTPTSSERFGRWLFENRKKSKLTQQDLANAAKCSASYLSMIERGAKHPQSDGPLRPSEEIVEALARALGRPTGEALLAAGYAPPLDWLSITVTDRHVPILNDPNNPLPIETYDLHDDAREEYDKWYFGFEGEPGFSKLTPSQKDALVRRAMEVSKRAPVDFRKAVEDAQREREVDDR
jgi:transcriptional regulator with XRE-family HTH domain